MTGIHTHIDTFKIKKKKKTKFKSHLIMISKIFKLEIAEIKM